MQPHNVRTNDWPILPLSRTLVLEISKCKPLLKKSSVVILPMIASKQKASIQGGANSNHQESMLVDNETAPPVLDKLPLQRIFPRAKVSICAQSYLPVNKCLIKS